MLHKISVIGKKNPQTLHVIGQVIVFIEEIYKSENQKSHRVKQGVRNHWMCSESIFQHRNLTPLCHSFLKGNMFSQGTELEAQAIWIRCHLLSFIQEGRQSNLETVEHLHTQGWETPGPRLEKLVHYVTYDHFHVLFQKSSPCTVKSRALNKMDF